MEISVFQVVFASVSAAATAAVAFFAWAQWRVSKRIADLNDILAKETQRYAAVSQELLNLHLEQWSKGTKPWLFFDVETEGEKFVLHCVNAGKPTLYLSFAKLYSTQSKYVGFSVTHRIGKPVRTGEHYRSDLGPVVKESIKRSLSIGQGYVEPPGGLVYGASCRLIVEYYDNGSPRFVHRYFPLHLQNGVWDTDIGEPQF